MATSTTVRRLTRDQIVAAVGNSPRFIKLIEGLADDITLLQQLIVDIGTPGDFFSDVDTAIPGELVVFSDPSGKHGTRSTGTGFMRLLAGSLNLLTVQAMRAELGEKVFPLTDAATIDIDASQANNFRVTLGGNRTLANPTNLIDGQVFNIRIKQDATGSRTLAYGSKYKFPGGSAPALSTAANALDFMSCQYDAADDTLICVMNKAFS